MILLSACTRNHGDIGIWFGTWHVEQITAGGTPVNVEGDYFFQFQNKVVRVSQVWEEGDGKMTISFPDPDVFYIQMPGLEDHNDFTVTTTSSHDVIFSRVTTAGATVTYHLHKQP